MTTDIVEIGSAPSYWLVPIPVLPAAEDVLTRVRAGRHPKAVALVGYQDDAEASAIAPHLPYGNRGEGIEEIVFCRIGPVTGRVVEFEDDAWPGEDRTYVVDDPEEALALAVRFAVEHGAAGSVVLVVGDQEFVAADAGLVS